MNALIDDLHVVEGYLGLSHYRGERLTAEEMANGSQVLAKARAAIAALGQPVSVTTVEELKALDGQAIRAENGWVLTVEVSPDSVVLYHGAWSLDAVLWMYSELFPATVLHEHPTPEPEGILPGCTGDYLCPAPAHQHGCMTDTLGHCNEPEAHPAPKTDAETVARIKAEALAEHRRFVVSYYSPGLTSKATIVADLKRYEAMYLRAANGGAS